MAEARPSFFDFDVTKMMADFRFRPFDVEAFMACQRRNIEALSQANQLAVEGAQAVARRQIEMARQALEDVSSLFRDMVQPSFDRGPHRQEYRIRQADAREEHQPRPRNHDAGDQGEHRGGRRVAQARQRRARRMARDGEAAGGALTERHAIAGAGRTPHRGRWTRARRPPCGERSSLTSPPWLRATSRAIVRPRPTPPVDGLREGSSRMNGRKTRPRSAGGIPGPSSSTRISIPSTTGERAQPDMLPCRRALSIRLLRQRRNALRPHRHRAFRRRVTVTGVPSRRIAAAMSSSNSG